ncbi:MAG: ABC transporter ATP-binding protein [Thermoanaerobaculia bacterium]|nr:ABC transporter ATP-binding protein [Thermoanaerobaculia bacterium]
MSPNSLITARSISWAPVEGEPVLGPLDLEVVPGESVAVLGPNGAGKTTLVRLLSGVLSPTTGGLRWQSEPYEALTRRALAREIGYLPQDREETVPLTIRELVALSRYPHRPFWSTGLTGADRGAVERALETTRMGPLSHRPLVELSGGERQMAFLTAVAAQEASLWILDEPTRHLDPRHCLQVASLLRARHEAGTTLLFVTHDLSLAANLATRVVVLEAGRIAADGPPERILEPASLEQLFDAPFHVHRDGEETLVGLRYP